MFLAGAVVVTCRDLLALLIDVTKGNRVDGNGEGFAGIAQSREVFAQFEMLAVEAAGHLERGSGLHDGEIVDGQLRVSLLNEAAIHVYRAHILACASAIILDSTMRDNALRNKM